MALVGQYQQSAFSTPVNATTADASVVLANDNNVRTKHNSHDNDGTIHVQSTALASRPAAGTAGRFWITTDGLRAYIDDGASWDELAYFLPGTALTATTGTFTGALTTGNGQSIGWTSRGGMTATGDGIFWFFDGAGTSFSRLMFGGSTSSFPALKRNSAQLQARLADDSGYAEVVVGQLTANSLVEVTRTSQQLALRYDASNHLAVTVSSAGVVTYNATGASASHSFSDLVECATGLNVTGTTALGAVTSTSSIKSSSSSAGVGYATGAGGTVTQGSGSGKATGVTINTICGQIITDMASLAGGAEVVFTVTNSSVAALDVVVLSIAGVDPGGTSPVGDYVVQPNRILAGSFEVMLGNIGTTQGEALLINFVIIKSVTS